MRKNGFTLVELLAVIAIIAILSIMVAPNVIKTFNNTKKQNFVTETREVCREASNKFIRENILTVQETDYYKFGNDETHSLLLNGRSEFKYFVKVNTDGEVVGILTWDDTYTIKITNSNGIEPNNITDSDIVSGVDTTDMTVVKANNILSN